MAGRANSLTRGASGDLAAGPATWTMPASEVRVVLATLGELGHDVSSLIAAAKLTETNFEDPDVRLSCEAYGTLIARAQEQRFTPNLALEVQRALASRVAGDTNIDTIARHLAMSARSLQRRLSAEGVTYQTLVEETRKEAAGRYVASSTLSLAEIAYLVGYSEPASFHRAFKRWYGDTPETFRRRNGVPLA